VKNFNVVICEYVHCN